MITVIEQRCTVHPDESPDMDQPDRIIRCRACGHGHNIAERVRARMTQLAGEESVRWTWEPDQEPPL